MSLIQTLADRGALLSCTVCKSGCMTNVSSSLSDQLGYSPVEMQNCSIESIFTAESTHLLRKLFSCPPADEKLSSLALTFIRHSTSLFPVLASGFLEWRDADAPSIHLVFIPLGSLSHRLSELQNANEVMTQMLYSAKVAYWCIEFAEAVDITQTTR